MSGPSEPQPSLGDLERLREHAREHEGPGPYCLLMSWELLEHEELDWLHAWCQNNDVRLLACSNDCETPFELRSLPPKARLRAMHDEHVKEAARLFWRHIERSPRVPAWAPLIVTQEDPPVDHSTILHNTQHHPPTPDVRLKHELVRLAAREFMQELAANIPLDCREASLAFTKAEEAMLWANAALARVANYRADDDEQRAS